MEIIGLKDGNEKIARRDEDGAGFFRITDLKQGVKNPNRVNVFLNGKYEFSLDVSQVVDLKVKIGREITEAELKELKKASKFGKLYQRALEWVLIRPRSEREVRDYLLRKSEDIFDFSDKIVERLARRGYLNDRKFAEYYVENRFVKKGVSRRRLEMELLKKGVSRDIIQEVLSESNRNDEAEILKIIKKKRAKYDDERLIQYLCRQGFSYSLAQNLVRSYEKD